MKRIINDIKLRPIVWIALLIFLIGMFLFTNPQLGLVKYATVMFLISDTIYILYYFKRDIIPAVTNIISVFFLIIGLINWF